MAPSLFVRADAAPPPAGMTPPAGAATGGLPTEPARNVSDFNIDGGLTPEQLAAVPHDDRGPELNVVVWVLASFAFAFLSLRLYCKFSRGKRPWWDDYVLATSWVAVVIFNAFTSWAISLGWGKQPWDIPPQNIIPMFRAAGVGATFSIIASIWSKTSFALTILRLVEGSWMRPTIWVIIITMNLLMGLTALFQWIHCRPISKGIDPTVPGTCWPDHVLSNYEVFSAAYSGAMDIILALLPWKIIWGLRMKKKEKLGVAIAMSMGIFAGITSFVKASKLTIIGTGTVVRDGAVEINIWSCAESTVSIMAASIPVLRLLVHEVGKTIAERYSRTRRSRASRLVGTTSDRRTGGGSYAAGTTANADSTANNTVDNSSRVCPGPQIVSSRNVHAHHDTEKSNFGDSMSEDSSGNAGTNGSLKILKTNEVALEYSERRAGKREGRPGRRGDGESWLE